MTTAKVTKMLLLGAVAVFEPINGYQVRRELVSWGVEDWANIRPGSIYHGLNSLASAGHLTRYDLNDDGREVAVYELTDSGREFLRQLMIEALIHPETHNSLAFQTAFGQSGLLDRAEVAHALRERIPRLHQLADSFRDHQEAKPPLVQRGIDHVGQQLRAEAAWLEELVRAIDAGDFSFRGEPLDWTVPDDDPGHQMSRDRERYLSLLGRPAHRRPKSASA